jgi:hypothetical protein
MWHDGRSKQLFATRSNKAATRFGPRVRIKPPGGTSAVWKLKGEGTRGRLDLLAAVSTGSSLATWHTQVLPPLSMGAKKRATSVTFTVSDAGDPVSGAAVTYAGKTLATNAEGQATAPLATRKTKATVGKAGYHGASVSVTP